MTGALILGILFSSIAHPGPQPSLVVLACILTAAWATFLLKKTRLSFVIILIAIMAAGASLHTHQNRQYTENALHSFKNDQYADFYGRISKSPSRGLDADILIMEVEKIGYEDREEKISGNLRVFIPCSQEIQKTRALLVGDKIKVSARMSNIESFRNFNPPASVRTMKIQNIHNKAYSKSPLLVEKLESREKISLARTISLIRQRLQEKIETHFPGEEGKLSEKGAVMEALMLGERDRIPDSLIRTLQKSGLYHLFAISGAHIGIISFLIFSFFKIIRLPTRISYGLLMFFLVFYALLVEGRPSVFRATIMALAFLTGKLIWSQVNLLNTLALSAFILLVLNPMQLYSLGFQLTFMATLCIILFFPKIMKYMPKLPLRTSEIFALSCAAYIGVMPFIAFSFNRITFSSLLLNIAAIPLVGLIMAAGYVFLMTAFAVPFLAGFLADMCGILIQGLVYLSHFPDIVSFVSFRVPTPHILVVVFYFVFLFSFLLPSAIKKQKWISSICFLAISAVLITYPFSPKTEFLSVTLIDVGQGESILVEFPGHQKMLVDGGGFFDDRYDIGEKVVSRFLWNKGIKKLDIIVLTHAHPDHLNGLKSITRNFKIREFWEAVSPIDDPSYSEFKSMIQGKAIHFRAFRGHTRSIEGVMIEVLHPQNNLTETLQAHNDQSIVIRLSFRDIAILLTGDIGENAEREIMESSDLLKSQVFKSPHHGSKSSSSPVFLEAVEPEIIVISVGNQNIYGLPDPMTLERYDSVGAKIFRTDTHGAIEISTNGRDIRLRTSVSLDSR